MAIPYDSKWQPQINLHYKQAQEKLSQDKDGLNLIGVFLYGSQNYGLEFENSDVDTIAYVRPSPLYMTKHDKFYKDEIQFYDGGKCVLRDVRTILRNLITQSDALAYETLFTPYNRVNDLYVPDWKAIFIGNSSYWTKEGLATIDPEKALKNAMAKQHQCVIDAASYRHCRTKEEKQKFCKIVSMGQYFSLYIQSYMRMLELGEVHYEDLIYNKDNLSSLRSIKCGDRYFNSPSFVYCDWYDQFAQSTKTLNERLYEFLQTDTIAKFLEKNESYFNSLKTNTEIKIADLLWFNVIE